MSWIKPAGCILEALECKYGPLGWKATSDSATKRGGDSVFESSRRRKLEKSVFKERMYCFSEERWATHKTQRRIFFLVHRSFTTRRWNKAPRQLYASNHVSGPFYVFKLQRFYHSLFYSHSSSKTEVIKPKQKPQSNHRIVKRAAPFIFLSPWSV